MTRTIIDRKQTFIVHLQERTGVQVTKRHFFGALVLGTGAALCGIGRAWAKSVAPLVLSQQEWRRRLTRERFEILRKEGTEPPFSSALNDEKRDGTYHCAGCELALFESSKKYDSGTGWPSFYDVIASSVETKTDFKLILPRTEYHCARCGGHQGHVFKDGPKPTGLRYCNNGLALTFKPAVEPS
jgi:peptide-methionine (R)-S-oxide reductase